MKKWLVLIIAVVIASSSMLGHSLRNTMALEQDSPSIHRLYKSVEIREGDSLWSLARRYSVHGDLDIRAYIQEVKHMNRLTGDTIHAGEHLTVLYFVAEPGV